jgi:hypothetical protein
MYRAVFIALYRGLRAVNGTGERHEYVAAMVLSVCLTANLGAAVRLYALSTGARLLPANGRAIVFGVCLAIFAVHWFVLIRGHAEEEFATAEGSPAGTLAAATYVVGTVAFLAWSAGR